MQASPQEMSWRLLNETYGEAGLVLALGAGVSMGCELPNWGELLRRMADQCAPAKGRALVDELCNEGFSLPAIAGMLRARCRDTPFYELVRENLYSTFLEELPGAQRSDFAGLVEFVQQKNPTMRAIAALCAIRSPDSSVYRKNDSIHAILNFNIDSVLRAYVQARYWPTDHNGPLVRSVERPSKRPHPRRISVYYMHGFLRFDSSSGLLDKEAYDQLVLSEHEYYDFFNSPTSLFNYAFLHLLREHACLFLGLSMRDDNIRRLLHYSAKERIKAYVEEGKSHDEAVERSCRHFAVLNRSASSAMNDLVKSSLAQLGVRVLWIDSYDEIPDRLGAMYASMGKSWSLVY